MSAAASLHGLPAFVSQAAHTFATLGALQSRPGRLQPVAIANGRPDPPRFGARWSVTPKRIADVSLFVLLRVCPLQATGLTIEITEEAFAVAVAGQAAGEADQGGADDE